MISNFNDTFYDSAILRIGCGEEMYSHAGGGSGGYLEHVIKHAANQLFGFNLESVAYKTLRLEVKNIITARKRSCGKVMFLHLSFILVLKKKFAEIVIWAFILTLP